VKGKDSGLFLTKPSLGAWGTMNELDRKWGMECTKKLGSIMFLPINMDPWRVTMSQHWMRSWTLRSVLTITPIHLASQPRTKVLAGQGLASYNLSNSDFDNSSK
jgi:hypothetical protein